MKGKDNSYILQHDRNNCIGCGACGAVAPDFWEMKDDGKVQLKNGKKAKGEFYEFEIAEKDLNANKEAADSCPVNVIHIVNKGTKEKII